MFLEKKIGITEHVQKQLPVARMSLSSSWRLILHQHSINTSNAIHLAIHQHLGWQSVKSTVIFDWFTWVDCHSAFCQPIVYHVLVSRYLLRINRDVNQVLIKMRSRVSWKWLIDTRLWIPLLHIGTTKHLVRKCVKPPTFINLLGYHTVY